MKKHLDCFFAHFAHTKLLFACRQSRWDLGTSSTWVRAVPAPLAPVKMPQLQQFPQLHCEETWGKHLMKSQQFQQNRRNLVSNFEVQEFCWYFLFICFAFSERDLGIHAWFLWPMIFRPKDPRFCVENLVRKLKSLELAEADPSEEAAWEAAAVRGSKLAYCTLVDCFCMLLHFANFQSTSKLVEISSVTQRHCISQSRATEKNWFTWSCVWEPPRKFLQEPCCSNSVHSFSLHKGILGVRLYVSVRSLATSWNQTFCYLFLLDSSSSLGPRLDLCCLLSSFCLTPQSHECLRFGVEFMSQDIQYSIISIIY